MARHARFGRRNASETSPLDRGMAISAINSKPTGMVFMAERHRLLTREILFGNVGGSHERITKAYKQDGRCGERCKEDPRDGVSPWSKDLPHSSRIPIEA
jgi:hypothetical protein